MIDTEYRSRECCRYVHMHTNMIYQHAYQRVASCVCSQARNESPVIRGTCNVVVEMGISVGKETQCGKGSTVWKRAVCERKHREDIVKKHCLSRKQHVCYTGTWARLWQHHAAAMLHISHMQRTPLSENGTATTHAYQQTISKNIS